MYIALNVIYIGFDCMVFEQLHKRKKQNPSTVDSTVLWLLKNDAKINNDHTSYTNIYLDDLWEWYTFPPTIIDAEKDLRTYDFFV